MKEPMKKAMNSSAITIFSKRWQKLPLLLMFFFLSSTTFTLNSASSSVTQPSYKDHCASIIPESEHSSQKAPLGSFPLSRSHDAYYTGGNPFLNPNPNRYYWGSVFLNSMSFRTMAVYATTNAQDLFKVEGNLTFQGVNTNNHDDSSYRYGGRGDQGNSVTFSLSGFWSESSRNLCMVGSGSTYSKEGNQLNLAAVLKLHNITKNTNITSLITGTLKSVSSASDPDHFEAISILMLPQYTSPSADVSNGDSGGSDIPQGLSLSSLPPKTFCLMGYRAGNKFSLKYSKGCNSTKKCSPFDHAGIGYVPRAMSLYTIQCSEKDERLRVLVEFAEGSYVSYYRSFNPNTTLVGEGSWDEEKNQLVIVACRFLGTTESLANVHVGDCSTKLIFRFPKTWSINVSSNILGKIWSNKTVNEAGYFDRIKLKSSDPFGNRMVGVPENLKYEYTKIDTARKLCSDSDTKKIKGKGYPDAFSSNMRFYISIKHSKQEVGWGNSEPLFVGDRFYEHTGFTSSEVPANPSISPPVTISYRIGLSLRPSGELISPFNSSSYESWEILAEGIYDAETGSLCMVGCRNVGSDSQIPIDDPNKDCEILVKFQFPPLDSKNEGKIKGSITSTRNETDPLYFKTLNLSGYDQASSWRMDMEIIMVLISTTLSCVLVVQQLFHVKRHPDVLPFISLATLSVLTLGNMIPLMLNFEALFFDNRGYRYEWFVRGGLLEANEVIVRVTGMVAFLLQFRLLQQTWSARLGDGNQKVLWIAEKKSVFVVLPLYVAGAFLALLIANWKEPHSHPTQYGMISSSSMDYTQRSRWVGLKSYAGLVLDGFLLPQILLNMFRNSKENALSIPFYIGTTFVRVLPHAYDLYRAHNYARNYDGSNIYANSGSDFYSTAWDVVIPLGGLLFAAIIYLQQRFGGRCILPRKYRELEVYEKVPVVSDDA